MSTNPIPIRKATYLDSSSGISPAPNEEDIAAAVAAEVINEAPRRPNRRLPEPGRFRKFQRGERADYVGHQLSSP